MSREATVVYTDGACKGNPGPGGWAWVVPHGSYASGHEPSTTNQRMELTAVLDALGRLAGPVDVVSDSTYVVNCFRDGWWEGWLRRGWRNSRKEPVANRDLWEPLLDLYRPRHHEISFRWVKGHSGDEWNDIADRLAVEAVETRRGRAGTGVPSDPGQADVRGALADPAPDPPNHPPERAPTGAVTILGLQPPGLGGYDDNPIAADVRRRLAEILAAKKELDPDLVVLTGLRLGAETLGAEAAMDAGVDHVVVLPYPDPERMWPAAARQRFRRLVDAATHVVQLERRVPESKQRAGQALDRRNGWLRSVADEAVIVWDGTDRRVGELVRAFDRAMPDEVWVLEVGDGRRRAQPGSTGPAGAS
ncbi:MAG: ribonuclease H [Acidimicrobiales bacterium]